MTPKPFSMISKHGWRDRMERTVLLYNFGGKRLQAVRKALSPLGCRVMPVPEKDFGMTIGSVLGIHDIISDNKPQETPTFKDEMLVMYGFQGEMIDVLLAALRMGGVGKIPLKAVVTQNNINWSSTELYREIKAEHEYMNR